MYDSIKKLHRGARSLLCLGVILCSSPGSAKGPTPAGQVQIPPGCFRLGSYQGYADERPAHKVCLDRFAMDRTEVTVAAFGRCVAAGRCKPPTAFEPSHPVRRGCNWQRPGRSRHPINCVTWSTAQAYCNWRGGRLPTEAEWERAARLRGRRTARAPFPWGRAPADCRQTRIARVQQHRVTPGCGQGTTAPVGSKRADCTPAGVCDLVGNVSEWVGDRFSRTYYKSSPSQNPSGPTRGRARTVRGCSYACVPGSLLLRVTARQFGVTWDPTIGFRCARGF